MFKVRDIDLSSDGDQPYGWNRTSRDYNDHLAQIMRTTSILTDVPRYSDVHTLFKNKAVTNSTMQTSCLPKTSKKKVHIAEQEKTIMANNNGGDSGNGTVEESIDVDADADSFIQQKHKSFELCKWTTFKRAR